LKGLQKHNNNNNQKTTNHETKNDFNGCGGADKRGSNGTGGNPGF
jgi:hypothetical protein